MINEPQIMVDIETMGTKSYSAIVSIAAVEFYLDGRVEKAFIADIDLQSCINAKLRIDGSTVKWWMQQSEPARQKIYTGNKIGLKEAIQQLKTFISEVSPSGIWGNGSRFDLGLIENAANAIGITDMWPNWIERDVRTLVSFAPDIKKSMPFDGVAHSPIDDCLHQIKYCCAIYNKLRF